MSKVKGIGKSRSATMNEFGLQRWVDKGLNILSRQRLSSEKIDLAITGPTYLSIDMDIGSLSSVFSARFMNSYGLNAKEFLDLLLAVQKSISESQMPLVGLDVMEIDIHFLETIEEISLHDSTRDIVRSIFEIFL